MQNFINTRAKYRRDGSIIGVGADTKFKAGFTILNARASGVVSIRFKHNGSDATWLANLFQKPLLTNLKVQIQPTGD